MNLKRGKLQSESNQKQIRSFSKFKLVTIGSMIVAIILLWFDYRFAIAVLAAYGLLILIAPFSLQLAFFLPIINKAASSKNKISLTFDDGPDPAVTGLLLDLLSKYQIKAAFFVIGRKAQSHPQLIQRMVEEGHEIGNHSQKHDPILMLRRNRTIFKEIEDCQKQLSKLGIKALAFRPPVGITNPKLHKILVALGMYCVGFSCRPGDFGNRRAIKLAGKIISKVKPGDIVLLHDISPNPAFSVSGWLNDIENIIIGIKQKNLSIVPLSELINKPVMQLLTKES